MKRQPKVFLLTADNSNQTPITDWCEAESALLETETNLKKHSGNEGISAPSSLNEQTQITTYLLREWQKEEDLRAETYQKSNQSPQIPTLLNHPTGLG